MSLRALVVDDSAVFRRIVSDALSRLPETEVVGTAADGEQALAEIDRLAPDVITLDLEMPILDGISTLRRLGRKANPPAVIVVSAQTREGATISIEALGLGALEVVTKPNGASAQQNAVELERQLRPAINGLQLRRIASGRRRVPGRVAAPPSHVIAPQRCASIVAIGISTGGPATLAKLLPGLPANFPVPVVVVQHMPPLFTEQLAASLNRQAQLTVTEGKAGEQLAPGHVYIAPGGKHMRLRRSGAAILIELTTDPPENHCRPAVDYLFRSVAELYGDRAVAAVMTGMGNDGTAGLREIRQCGGLTLAQDEASCVVYGMPREAVEAGVVDAIVPLDKLADQFIQACTQR